MRRAQVLYISLEEVAHLVADSDSKSYEQQCEQHVFPAETVVDDVQYDQIERNPTGDSGGEPHYGIHHAAAVEIKK